jgi:hypothetical protein
VPNRLQRPFDVAEQNVATARKSAQDNSKPGKDEHRRTGL